MKKPLFCLLFAVVAWLPLAHAQDDGSSFGRLLREKPRQGLYIKNGKIMFAK